MRRQNVLKLVCALTLVAASAPALASDFSMDAKAERAALAERYAEWKNGPAVAHATPAPGACVGSACGASTERHAAAQGHSDQAMTRVAHHNG